MARKKKETIEEIEDKEVKKGKKDKEEVVEEAEEVEEIEELSLDKDDDDDDDEYEALTVEDRLTNIEKKTNLILILVVIAIAFSLITMMSVLKENKGTSVDGSSSNSSSSASGEYDTSSFKRIKAIDIANESKGETIVVWLGRQGCGFCSKFAPIMAEVAKTAGVTARYINVLDFLDITTSPFTVTDKTAYDTIANLKGVDGVETLDNTGTPKALRGTPATLFVKDGKIVGIISGYVSAEDLYAAFQRYGLVK